MNISDIAEQLLHDTADIWYTSVWETFVGYAILSVLALIVSVVVGWCIKKFFYTQKTLSAQEKAYVQIRSLAYTSACARDFYAQLIEYIKDYLALYAQVPAHILTEHELKQALEKSSNRQLINLLVPVLEHACAAKFDQYSFSAQTGEQDRQRVLAALKIIIGRSF